MTADRRLGVHVEHVVSPAESWTDTRGPCHGMAVNDGEYRKSQPAHGSIEQSLSSRNSLLSI